MIRCARAADETALRELDLRTWSEGSPAPLPPAERPYFDAGRGVVPEDVLVAERDRAITGYIRLERPTPLASNAHVLEIAGIAVDPSARRAGIGRALIEAAAQEAAARGATRLRLRVLGSNDAARALYERCGFVLEGTLRGEFVLDGRPVDDLLMARPL